MAVKKPPSGVLHDNVAEDRVLRSRTRDVAEAANRRIMAAASGTARMLVQIFDGGSIPTCAPCVYLANPVDTDATATEGNSPTFAVDTAQPIPVVMLNSPANVGDIVVAHNVGGTWVAEKTGGGHGQFECLWFCGAQVVLGGCPPSLVNGPAAIVPVVEGGVITGVIIDAVGSYNNCVPTITFSPGPTGDGSGATGIAIMRDSGCSLAAAIDNPGQGYTAVPNVTVSGGVTLAGGSLPTSATATLTGGSVTSVFIDNPGSGYTPGAVIPITFPAPLPGGTVASAHAVADANGMATNAGLTIDNAGSLYATAPIPTLGPPNAGGTQATASCTVSTIGVGTVTLNGPGYLVTTAPTLTIDPPPAGGVRATAHAVLESPNNWKVSGVTITSGGSGYTDPTPPATLILTITADSGTFGPFTLTPGWLIGPPPDTRECYWSWQGLIAPGVYAWITFGSGSRTIWIEIGVERNQSFQCEPTGDCSQCDQPIGGSFCNGPYVIGQFCGPSCLSECYEELIGGGVFDCGYQAGGNCTGCPGGYMPGTGETTNICGTWAGLSTHLPACTSRPYSGSATACASNLFLSANSCFGGLWKFFGGDCTTWHGGCGDPNFCYGPLITFTISEP